MKTPDSTPDVTGVSPVGPSDLGAIRSKAKQPLYGVSKNGHNHTDDDYPWWLLIPTIAFLSALLN